MNSNVIFNATALVELSGEFALEYISHNACEGLYKVIGFNAPNFTIQDNRKHTIPGLINYFKTDDPTEFINHFNSLAFVELHQLTDGNYLVKLSDAHDNVSDHILWIAIGIGKYIPAYDYMFIDSRPLVPGKFALVSIYHYCQVQSQAIPEPCYYHDLQV